MAEDTVEPCAGLKHDLDALIAQEGESTQNRFLIAQAKNHLNEGVRLSTAIYNKLDKTRAAIDELQKKFSIVKAVKIFDMIPKITAVIEDGYPFVYSDGYKHSTLELQADFKKLLDRYYLQAIQQAKCSITELSQYKAAYTQVARILRDNAFEDYAIATENRIATVETELLAKQHYESSLNECAKDLLLATTTVNYQEAIDLAQRFCTWLNFIDGAEDLPASVGQPLRERIENAISVMKEVQSRILKDYQDTITTVETAGSVAELKQADLKLSRLLQNHLPNDCVQNILLIQEAIHAAICIIEDLPTDIDAITLAISTISQESNPYCYTAIWKCAMEAKEKLEKEEQKWVKRYLDVAESNYHTMIPLECTNWLEKTSHIPTFLSSNSIERYRQVRALVEDRLHHARVVGLLALYEQLSEDEKSEFKQKIGQL